MSDGARAFFTTKFILCTLLSSEIVTFFFASINYIIFVIFMQTIFRVAAVSWWKKKKFCVCLFWYSWMHIRIQIRMTLWCVFMGGGVKWLLSWFMGLSAIVCCTELELLMLMWDTNWFGEKKLFWRICLAYCKWNFSND